MNNLRQRTAHLKSQFLREGVFAFALFAVGAAFVAVGAHRFWVRPEPFNLLNVLGCGVGAVGGFFIWLVTDYVFHHARLVSIPWFVSLVYFAYLQPHFAVGMGLALWFMTASQAMD